MILHLYEILFPDAKRYFGVTRDPAMRWRAHCARGAKRPVSEAIQESGAAKVCFRVILTGPRRFILEMEQKIIAAHGTCSPTKGYNVAPGGTAVSEVTAAKIAAKNRNPSAQTLQRMSAASSSRSPETIQKMRDSHRGKTADVATRAKMSESRRGKTATAETREKLSQAKRGRVMQPDVRARLSALWTPERKAALCAQWTGRKHTDESRARMRLAQKRRPPCSAETREKLRIAAFRWRKEQKNV